MKDLKVLPLFGLKAIFGVMSEGTLAVEDRYSTRAWPSVERVPGMLFREDADIISREECMRRLAAAQALA